MIAVVGGDFARVFYRAYVTRGTVTGMNFDPVLANNRATRQTTVRR
jgi:hypothetical protein